MGRPKGSTASRKFTRRAPSIAEQRAREQWGAKWGPILRDLGRKLRDERG